MARRNKKTHQGDFGVLILSVAISLFGVIMQFSASYYVSLSKLGNAFFYLKDAIMWFAIGWVVFTVCSFIDYHFYKLLALFAICLGFILLGAIFTPAGVSFNNATRWIAVGPVTIMPGEIMKTCAIIFFAWYYADKKERIKKLPTVMLGLAVAGVSFVLIYKQPNLSTAIIVVAIMVGMMFLAGLSWWVIIGCGAAAAAGFAGILFFKGGYMLERFTSFLDPFADALGSGYQVVQGLLAMGSGGVFGVGLGNSIQKAFYLPEPQSDFILAIIGEELGFVGILCLLLAYLGLVYAIFNVALRSRDSFGLLLAGGVGLHFGLQVIMNVAVVTASMPATGVALPLVTLGGNSLVLYMAELGIVYNISKHSEYTEISEL